MKNLYFILLLAFISFNCERNAPDPTPLLPAVTTVPATSITASTALSGGNATIASGPSISARGVCWGTASNPDITGNHTVDGSGSGTFASPITGLTANTTYYVRAYATNIVGTSYGNQIVFTTTNSTTALPTVTTAAITAITATNATGGGEVTADGGATVTTRGVCWSTTANPTTALATKTTDGTGIGLFTSAITGLTAGLTYHVRAYATNSVGTVYGGDSVFIATASAGLPTLTTTALTSIYTTTAAGGGIITSDGGATITARGVCWSTTANPVATGNHTTNGTGTGVFTSAVTGLTKSTTYYVRAYATNSVGTAYGNEITMTTLDHDIYVGGSLFNAVTVHNVATIWKNGVATALTDGTQEAYVRCIYVNSTDVYAAGIENNGSVWIAKVWKNGVATALTDGTQQATVTSIFVAGSDVYISGSDGFTAKIWKNGNATTLPGGTYANSVFVVGADVYVCGDYYNYPISYALFWKNGVLTNLTNQALNSNANSVFVNGADVYVGGREQLTAELWKNGAATPLSNGINFNNISKVALNGSDVYVGGIETQVIGGIPIAKYWKNGTATLLTDGTNIASLNSFFFFGTDVYICVVDGAAVKIWKNGAPIITDVVPDVTYAIYLY